MYMQDVTLKIQLGYNTNRPLGVLKCIMPSTNPLQKYDRNLVSIHRKESIGMFCNLMVVRVAKCMAKTVHDATPPFCKVPETTAAYVQKIVGVVCICHKVKKTSYVFNHIDMIIAFFSS